MKLAKDKVVVVTGAARGIGEVDQDPGIEENLISETTLGKPATPHDQGNAALFLIYDLVSHTSSEYLVESVEEFMNA